MIELACYDNNGNTISYLTQWDLNRTIYIENPEFTKAPLALFSNNSSTSYLVATELTENHEKIKIIVPNLLLQKCKTICMGLCHFDIVNNVNNTKYFLRLPIRKLAMPANYAFTDNIVDVNWIRNILDEFLEGNITNIGKIVENHINNINNVTNHTIGTIIPNAQNTAIDNINNIKNITLIDITNRGNSVMSSINNLENNVVNNIAAREQVASTNLNTLETQLTKILKNDSIQYSKNITDTYNLAKENLNVVETKNIEIETVASASYDEKIECGEQVTITKITCNGAYTGSLKIGLYDENETLISESTLSSSNFNSENIINTANAKYIAFKSFNPNLLSLNITFHTDQTTKLEIGEALLKYKQDTLDLINQFSSIDIKIVQELPTTDISTTTIYLVPNSSESEHNYYIEYLNLNGTVDSWEVIGTTQFDLSDYVKNSLTIAGLSLDKNITSGNLVSAILDDLNSNGIYSSSSPTGVYIAGVNFRENLKNKIFSSASGEIGGLLISDYNGSTSGLNSSIMRLQNSIVAGQNNTITSNSLSSHPVFVFGRNWNSSNVGQYSTLLTGEYGNVSSSDIFVVGNGTDSSNSNAMRLTHSGYLYYKTGCGDGADYAEFFEWSDGNSNSEDRCGLFVTFDFDKNYNFETAQDLPKIKVADEGDYILGIISGNPSFVGNSDECWKKRWLYDEFDRPILETVQVPITELQEVETGNYRTEIQYDENDKEIEVQVPITQLIEIETGKYRTEVIQVQNPDYNENIPYENRFDRDEWDTTGMLGVLSVKDDGTCEAGKYCRCGKNGIATLANERTLDTFLVLRRVNDNIIKIMFK